MKNFHICNKYLIIMILEIEFKTVKYMITKNMIKYFIIFFNFIYVVIFKLKVICM